MIPDCTACGHNGNDHRPEDPDAPWECKVEDCDCPEIAVERPQLGEVIPYSRASAQVMTPEQIEQDDEDSRAYQAQKLLVAGHTWREIAEMTGYPSAGAAQMSVRHMRQRAALQLSAERREEMLELEMMRLEELLKAYWPAAHAGDLKSAEFALKVIGQQSRMLGLEEMATSTKTASSKTVVIAGNAAEYAAALKSFVEEQ